MNIGKKLLMAIAAVMVTAIVAVTVSAICTPIVCEKDCSTKVEQCDIETVMMLDPVDWARVVAVGPDVYIDMDVGGDDQISAGDIRLTQTCCGAPNTKVYPHDNTEIGRDFTVLPQDIFTYMDSNANTIYDVGDAIYLDVDNEDMVSVNDIRLTDSPPFDVLNGDGSVAIPAGYYGLKWSRVKIIDNDFGAELTHIGDDIGFAGNGTLQALGGYIDGDCSGDWTCPDKLYLNQPTDLWQFDEFVTIGDLRLYMPPDADVMPEGMGECMPDCGTRVRQCAKDAVYALRVDTGATWGYDDEITDDIFTPGNCPDEHLEGGYIDMDNDGFVSVGDVRVTSAVSCEYPPNSKVADCDRDLHNVLETPQAFADHRTDPQTVFRYVDLDGVPGYSLGDPVYMDVDDSNDVSKYDVRLTQSPVCQYEIFAPGAWGANWSIVKQTDYDATNDMDLIPLPNSRTGGAAVVSDLLGFVDSDCNLCWSCPDKLYLQQLVGEDNYDLFVTIGDVRLYIPPNATGPGPDEPCWEPCGTKVWQCDVDLVYALMGMPDMAQVRYVDEDTSGGYTIEDAIHGDGVYIDMDGDGEVSVGDIRLSHVCHTQLPNTKVGVDPIDNDDLGDIFAPVTNDKVVYADIDGIPGYSLGDPLYLSMYAPHNIIQIGDIRLTASPVYAGFYGATGAVGAAWTRVLPTDVDAGWTTPIVPVRRVNGGVLEEITQIFDSDCSGTWTCPDKLYLQQTKDMFVTIGDERLYIPNSTIESQEYDPYDTNKDCEISMTELAVAIGDWKAGTLEMTDLARLIGYWKAGSYC